MKIIDSDNYLASGIETMFFPGGEPHAKLPPISGDVLLFLKPRTWDDVGLGACVIDGLTRSDADRIVAFIPYFPAARQDKTKGDAPLTLALTVRLLGRGRHSVVTFDEHSLAMEQQLGHHACLMPRHLQVPTRGDVVGVIAPDEGAVARANSFRDAFYPDCPLVQCFKKRDPRTGALSGYVLPLLTESGCYVVVDDICDGGGTFNLLAQAFEHDPRGSNSQLELFVSHGIFSKGVGAISPRYRHITTTDSWCRLDSDDRLTVLRLSPLFERIMRSDNNA
jgi:ribose-phosphate pyrophosphokinase